jgi:hypothetical protein
MFEVEIERRRRHCGQSSIVRGWEGRDLRETAD